MEGIRQLVSDALAALGRLSPRERGLVGLAGGAVLVFAVVFISLSVGRSIDRQEARIKTKQGQLDEIGKLTGTFRAQESMRKELEQRLQNNKVKLFSYLEELAKKDSISIGGMNDKGTQPLEGGAKINESSVEVTFTRIPLDKLVKFLQDVESGQGLVKVTRLQVRPRSDEPVLDAWLVVTTYTLES
ncbi:MAG TPA: type II secretion system protein GspM [Myxococcales bacterium]|jgi:general secretion pathway protein M